MKLLLCSENMSIFKSIIVLIYSLNNIHVGAKLNREQITIKLIKNITQRDSENRKKIKLLYCTFRPETGRAAHSTFALQLDAAHSARTAHVRPIRPSIAHRRRIESNGRPPFSRIKIRATLSPVTLAPFSSSPFLFCHRAPAMRSPAA